MYNYWYVSQHIYWLNKSVRQMQLLLGVVVNRNLTVLLTLVLFPFPFILFPFPLFLQLQLTNLFKFFYVLCYLHFY